MKFIFVLIQFALLAAGYGVFLNQWIRPSTLPIFNLLPLTFLLIFIINSGLLFFWWIFDWKSGLLFTILSAGLLIPFNNHFHLFGEPEVQESNLKIITYNVRYFYDNPSKIINTLQKEKADIVLFQEAGPNPESIIQQAESDFKYYYENFNSLGIASRYPIIEAKKFRTPSFSGTYGYADIALPEDTVRVINFYLESLRLDQKAIKKTEINSEIPVQSKNLVHKVVRASYAHEKQVDQIRKFISGSPYPVILAGDMNAVPNSYEYYTLKRGLKDAFRTGGKGLASTFPGFKYPLRIDYIFVPENFKVKTYRTIRNNASDHYAVVTEMFIE